MAKRKSSETIDDLGEKIGGARKDMAVSVGPRRPRPKVDADPRPAWMRRFIPTNLAAIVENRKAKAAAKAA